MLTRPSLIAAALSLCVAACFASGSLVRAQASSFTVTFSQSGDPRTATSVVSDPPGIRGRCFTACSQSYAAGTTVTLHADRNDVAWGGACAGTSGAECTVVVDRDLSVDAHIATFELSLDQSHDPAAIVTVNPDPYRTFASSCRPGGCHAQYAAGTVVQLSANETPGLQPRTIFDHWEGACAGQGQTCSLTMDGNKHVDVVWKSGEPTTSGAYTLTIADANASGVGYRVTPPNTTLTNCYYATCALKYDAGATVTITPFNASGYVFDHWDGACKGQDRVCTITISGDTRVVGVYIGT
jgi:hypothetical protein